MKNKMVWNAALMLATFGLATDADAELINYTTNYPTVEINGSLGGNTARDLIAAMRMAARGFGDVAISPIDEPMLLMKCQSNTAAATTFFEQCDLVGASKGTNQYYGQGWGVPSTTDLGTSLWKQVVGMAYYGSPIVIPLKGQPGRWGVVHKLTGDIGKQNSLDAIALVSLYDASDLLNGPKEMTGQVYKGTYFLKLPNLPVADPVYNKYFFAYDPPPIAMMTQKGPQVAPDLQWLPGQPMVGEDDVMTVELAELLALDAPDVEGLLDRPEYRHLAARGFAGPAVRVDGRTGTGAVRDYYFVPIHDIESGLAIGTVLLNAQDGAFEELHAFTRPQDPHQRDAGEALALARAALRPGEQLLGGAVRWTPDCNKAGCLSPDEPFYEYQVTGAATRSATIYVPLGDAPAIRR